ncbi:MAG: PaaI family thioesterase [Pseudomonadota bacterium]
MDEIPEGYEPLFRTSPFLDLIGPIYNKKLDDGLLVGMRVQEKHCNARGSMHGGVFSSLADIALGYSSVLKSGGTTPLVTANLSLDFAGSAQLGDWVEITTDVQKIGKRMAFANCYFAVNDKRIVRASAVFGVIQN